jgi:hypothetical protein
VRGYSRTVFSYRGGSIVQIQNKVAANLDPSLTTHTTRSILQRVGLLVNACLELVEPSIGAVTAKFLRKNTIDSKLIFDLEQAETMFSIDRQILLTAIANHQLPASFTDDRHYIKYKDLERFLDAYYYQKNPMLGTYCPKLVQADAQSEMPSSSSKDDRGK